MPRITIVGAGIAGMSLARCLRAKGIPTVILERHKIVDRTNYSITLRPWGYQSLLRILQVDELTFREQLTCGLRLGGKNSLPKYSPFAVEGASPDTFRCLRKRLEKWLLTGLDIRDEHAMLASEEPSDSLPAIRINGEEPGGENILVGADGVHSHVRKSSAPRMHVNVLPYVVFYGKREMSSQRFQDTIAPYVPKLKTIEAPNGNVLLRISITRFSAETVSLDYTYSRPAGQDDPLYRPNRATHESRKFPDDIYSEIEELRPLRIAIKEIFDSQKIREDKVASWLMRSMLPPLEEIQNLADRGILLIGDAVHAMPILGGEGANMAMKDGADLAEHLAQHGLSGIRDFYKERYQLWKEVVEESEKRLSEMHIPARSMLS